MSTTPSARPLIVVPGDDPVQLAGSPHLSGLSEYGDVVLYTDRPQGDGEKVRRARDAVILINSRGAVKWPGSVLEQLPNLRSISVCGIGTDAIDLDAARRQGIVVSNIPGNTRPIVAEHALALMLAAARRVAFHTGELKAGRWACMDNVYLRGKTLGIVGTGPIGGQVAQLARAIGMNVIAWTFHPSPQRAAQLGVRFVELDELVSTSDVVSLHVKLTPQSRHLIGRRELARMKRGALIVNTARGAILDTDALVEALRSGHLGGAALDVYDAEPVSADHPLLSCDQVVLTPHNADQTPEGTDILNAGAVENVISFLNGSPQNVVT